MYKALASATTTIKNSAPILSWRRRRYERLFAHSRGSILYRGVYHSFEEAERAAPAVQPIGYNNPESSLIHRSEVDHVNPRDYPVLFWLGEALRAGARTIVDLGGHVGHKFYAFRKYLHYPEGLTWLVCDVPAVTEAGRALAQVMSEGDRIRFTTRFEDADGCDLLLAAGCLQYIDEPLHARLARLRHPPAHVLLNGLPLHPSRSFVTLQNIGTAFCPYRVFRRADFLSEMAGVGYHVRDEWLNPEKSMAVPFHDDARVSSYSGLYLRTQR